MPRKAKIDEAALSEFGAWLLGSLRRRRMTLGEAAQGAAIDESYLQKILKSYLPQYRHYRRPSYEKTVALGRCLGDAAGALRSAGYPDGAPMEGADGWTFNASGREAASAAGSVRLALADGAPEVGGVPQSAEEWPSELLEAMHYSQTLPPEVQRYIYGLWREQARVYAALEGSRVEASGGFQEQGRTEKKGE